MPHFICTTCGMQYAEGGGPPAACAVCQDERQYVKAAVRRSAERYLRAVADAGTKPAKGSPGLGGAAG